MKKAFLQLHLSVFLAGFTAILGKLISLNESLLVWYRLLFTSIAMWALFIWWRKIQRIPRTEIFKIGGVGVIATLHWITFYAAIKQSNVSVALVCFSSISFFTALFEPLILKRKVNRIELFLGLVTIAGIYIIFHFDGQYQRGIIFGILSALLAALFPIFNREFLKRTNVETMLAWQQTGGLIVLSIGLPIYLHYFPVDRLLPGEWDLIWLLVLALFCSVLAFQLSGYALKKLSAFTVNLTFNLEPVYAIILAFIIFKENKLLSSSFYYGFAVIAIAILIHIFLLIKQERKLSRNAADGIS
jgi:drug/metabolite transporter (DMT)-like permease